MPTFDGDNLLITLDSGVISVDVETNLYSEWKQWMLIDDNAKYPSAFRTVGGDPLTPGIDAGAYFFLRNDYGWRIKPPEEDISVYVGGNLAPADSSLPILVPTIGGYTAGIFGLQPITQKVDDVLNQIRESAYNGEVWLDVHHGESGTKFPYGTASTPVTTLAEAMTIAELYKFRRLKVVGHIDLDRPMHHWNIEGSAGECSVNLNGQDVNGAVIKRAEIYGAALLSGVYDRVVFEECFIRPEGVTGFKGILRDVTFFGGLTMAGNTYIHDSRTGVPADTHIVLDADNIDGLYLDIQNMDGAITVSNFTGATSSATISMARGHLEIPSSNTAGTIFLQGTAHLDNNANGTVVDTHEFINQDLVKKMIATTVNKVVTDPIAGTITVYDEDDITILYQANLFENAAGTQQYRGQGAERRERLT